MNIARNPLHSYPNSIGFDKPGINSFQPVENISQGIPELSPPDLGNGIISVPSNVGLELADPNYQRSYIQSWNFTLEKQLGGRWVAQAGYVGTEAVHLQNRWNSNYGFVGGGTASEVLNQKFGRTATTNFFSDTGGFTSSYNGLQTSLEKGFSHGLQLKGTYTFSKSLGPGGGDNFGVDGWANNNPAYFGIMRSLEGEDHTHMFTLSGVAELPFGPRKRWATSGIGAKLLEGWQLNSLLTLYSGSPFTVSAASSTLNAPGNSQRADLVKPTVQILGDPSSYFDPLAFAPPSGAARFGTAGYNILRGPGVVNLDASLYREFRLSERFRLQFRAEMFNVANTPQFGNPSTNVSNLQLNPNDSIKSLGGFTQITSTANTGREGIDERFFRFGLHLSF